MSVTVMDRLAAPIDGSTLSVRPFLNATVLLYKMETTARIAVDRGRSEHQIRTLWLKVFKRKRINDLLLTTAERRAARKAKEPTHV